MEYLPQIFVRHAPPLLRLSLRVDCGADLRENKTLFFFSFFAIFPEQAP